MISQETHNNDISDIILRYQKVNTHFNKHYIFQIGEGRGFCADMIDLLKTIQMCLYTQTQLCLGKVSNPLGYSVQKGWEDYFLPVFPYKEGLFLQKCNRSQFPFGRIPLLQHISHTILKATVGKHGYMFDKFSWNYPKKVINEELLIQGNYWTPIQHLIQAIYRYREDVEDRIKEYKEKISLIDNQKYLAIHIRRGDKVIESPYVELERYAEIISDKKLDKLPIYLATDDLSIISDLKDIIGNNVDILNSNNSSAKGYDQKQFNHETISKRWEDTVFFLFELDMLTKSTMFLGSSPSNVFYWVRYTRANKNLIDVNSYKN